MQHSKQEERRAGFEPVGRQQRRHEHTASNFEFAERLPGDILSDSPSHSADGEVRRQRGEGVESVRGGGRRETDCIGKTLSRLKGKS